MKTLRIRNWEKWQSFRGDRGAPPWIKVHRKLLTDLEWVAMTDAQRGQLVAIWIIAADRGGVIPSCAKLIQKMCGMTSEPDLKLLMDQGFIERDANLASEWRQHDAPEERREEERRGEEKINSVSKETDASPKNGVPSLNLKSEVWRKGVNMLVAEGVPDRQARSLVGKWRKLSGGDDEALNDLLEQAVDANPAVLAEWMGAALSGKSTRIRMKGDNYIIPPGTDQWEAWHRFFIKLNDPRVYRKDALEVPSLWPR